MEERRLIINGKRLLRFPKVLVKIKKQKPGFKWLPITVICSEGWLYQRDKKNTHTHIHTKNNKVKQKCGKEKFFVNQTKISICGSHAGLENHDNRCSGRCCRCLACAESVKYMYDQNAFQYSFSIKGYK